MAGKIHRGLSDPFCSPGDFIRIYLRIPDVPVQLAAFMFFHRLSASGSVVSAHRCQKKTDTVFEFEYAEYENALFCHKWDLYD